MLRERKRKGRRERIPMTQNNEKVENLNPEKLLSSSSLAGKWSMGHQSRKSLFIIIILMKRIFEEYGGLNYIVVCMSVILCGFFCILR